MSDYDFAGPVPSGSAIQVADGDIVHVSGIGWCRARETPDGRMELVQIPEGEAGREG